MAEGEPAPMSAETMLQGLMRGVRGYFAALHEDRQGLCMSRYRGAVRQKMLAKRRKALADEERALRSIVAEVEEELAKVAEVEEELAKRPTPMAEVAAMLARVQRKPGAK